MLVYLQPELRRQCQVGENIYSRIDHAFMPVVERTSDSFQAIRVEFLWRYSRAYHSCGRRNLRWTLSQKLGPPLSNRIRPLFPAPHRRIKVVHGIELHFPYEAGLGSFGVDCSLVY